MLDDMNTKLVQVKKEDIELREKLEKEKEINKSLENNCKDLENQVYMQYYKISLKNIFINF